MLKQNHPASHLDHGPLIGALVAIVEEEEAAIEQLIASVGANDNEAVLHYAAEIRRLRLASNAGELRASNA
jgi:hypothetical protein